MKTAMITGINGQDGYYLALLLLEKGYRVVGLQRRRGGTSFTPLSKRSEEWFSTENLELEYYSLHDPTTLYRLLEKYNPDEFYNLGAQSHVGVSFDMPIETVDTIAMGTVRILEAIRHTDITIRMYQASSSEMFGYNNEIPFNESSKLIPASPYACAKVLAHNLVRNYRIGYGMHASAGILFNHESSRRGTSFVTRKITDAAARIKLGLQDKLYLGNIGAKRDWGFAGDYVEAMWLMLQQDEPDDYVIATGEIHSVRDWLNIVFDIAGLSVEKHVEIDEDLFRPSESKVVCGDSTYAQNRLGWVPRVRFEQLAKLMYMHDFENIKELLT